MGSPKILLLPERFTPEPGGIATSALRIARLIVAAYGECFVLVMTSALPDGRLEEEVLEGLRVWRLGRGRDPGRCLLDATERI